MTDQELLLAMSNLFDKKFAPLEKDVAELKSEVAQLKSEVTELKSEVAQLKSEVTGLKSEVAQLRSEVDQLKIQYAELRTDYTELREDYIELKNDNKSIRQEMREGFANLELIIENEIRPSIKLLAENYLPTVRRYDEEMKELENMKVDVTLLKKVVAEHSIILQNIS